MGIKFTTENQSFRKVMANGLQYHVPRFQRDYAWNAEQWEDLWDDLEATDIGDQHYMGYLVFQSDNEKIFSVIDGQQRLTTVSLIIIAALYKLNALIEADQEKEKNEQRLDQFRNNFIGFTDTVTLVTKPKLTLNRNNNTYYKNYICSLEQLPQRNITASERLLGRAVEYFQKRIDEKVAIDDGAKLAEFIETLLDKLLFTTITVGSDLNAYRVFETLNARGVQLSVPDLLKNYLFSLIDSGRKIDKHELKRLEDDWLHIVSQLGQYDFTKFVLAHWNSQNQFVSRGQLFKRIKQNITTRELAFEYLRQLRENSEIYAALQNGDDEFWRQQEYRGVQDSLRTLALFNIKQPHSMLLSVFRKFTSDRFCKAVKAIEVITIRYNVIGGRQANTQEHVYNAIARKVSAGEIANIQSLKVELRSIYPSDDEFCTDFKLKSMRTAQSPKKVRYLLAQLERHVSPDLPLDDTVLTLEHILPENPTPEWSEYFGAEDVSECVDKLGNMTLLNKQQNNNLARKLFNSKKEVLKESPLQISKKVANYESWNKNAVDDRQAWLADIAVSKWKIQFS
ncbi:MAG: DUF262 domain-containing protein [Robiginitomaculum sp.]|nr:DUF262 domain-containing protein [Robiginitomaculum sp.]